MWTIAAVFPPHFHELPPPQLDVVMIFGFLCAIATLICYLEQSRSRSFILAFAICSVLLAGFAFLKDAWPVGIVEFVWSTVAFKRWSKTIPFDDRKPSYRFWARPASNPWQEESRITRLFGQESRSN